MAVILITGCSTGIGLATALHLAAKGDTVYATARNPGGARELQAAMAGGAALRTRVLDVCDDASVNDTVAYVLSESGAIDVLVNNAGVGGGGSFENTPLQVARDVMETNYFGVVRMMQAVLPGMRERRSGTIVNVSSQAGRRPFAMMSHYCASKHALNAASAALAHEVAQFGIRVALIEPGTVMTPIFGKSKALAGDEAYAQHQRRLVRFIVKGLQVLGCGPDAIARAIEHAISTDDPKLHYLVEQDARDNVRVFEEQGPEQWVKDGAIVDDAEYFALQAQRYGYELG